VPSQAALIFTKISDFLSPLFHRTFSLCVCFLTRTFLHPSRDFKSNKNYPSLHFNINDDDAL
jgi:hypothetical protein